MIPVKILALRQIANAAPALRHELNAPVGTKTGTVAGITETVISATAFTEPSLLLADR